MIKAIDAVIALEGLKRILVEVKMHYEGNEDNYSLEYTTSDLFGTNTKKIVLPIQHRNIEFEVIRVKLSNGRETATLTQSHFEAILEGIKHHLIQYIYNVATLNQINAYLGKIDLLVKKVKRTLSIVISVDNEEALWIAGYPPDFIDHHKSKLQTRMSNEIITHLIEPLERLLEYLFRLTEQETSLRSLHRAVKEFSGISPENPEKRRSSVEVQFHFMKSQYNEHLPTLFELLIAKHHLIHKDTEYHDFESLFIIGSLPHNKIQWTGFIGELQQFISLMSEKKFIRKPSTIWRTTDHLFKKVGAKNLLSSLGHNQTTKSTRKMKAIAKSLSDITGE